MQPASMTTDSMKGEMDSNTSDDVLGPLSGTTYLCIGIYQTLMGLSSILCNGFVIIVLLKGKPKYNVMHNILLLNMAITDLLISVIAYPLSASSSLNGSWVYSDETCVFYGFWVFCLAMGNMNTLAVIAICRYIVAVRPEYNYLLTKKNAKYFLLVIWTYAILWTGPPLVGWSTYTFEAYRTSCTINWGGRSLSDKTYNVTITFTCYLCHLIICCFCYYHVLKKYVTANNSNIGITLRSSSVKQQNTEESFNVEAVVSYHKVTTSRKVTTMCIAMLFSYLFAWTPYTVLSIWVMFVGDVEPWVHVIPTMMAKTSTLSNSIVYGILSSKFRESAKAMFKRNRNRVAPASITTHRNQTDSVATSSRSQIHPTAVTDHPRPWDKHPKGRCHTYNVHLIKNDVYIGKNSVTLPHEEQPF
ncbi:pinopsin-like [Mizuhopecten yessoensis]|uniref:Pinopsin n=1 Tax=Mizuhopecten yessoensis TaxID=6573 RepID=A0A210QA12_MIZYE|nr:pinopsin-like [Mizuhopecten yessoensis]OWF45539.1 Pinopsin [Mizuhopecten yessoensis]